MHRLLWIALSLMAGACMSSKAKVAATPASSLAETCSREGTAAIAYFVDGKAATCAFAMTLPADRIVSVEVLKGAAAVAHGVAETGTVIMIRTKQDR